MKIASALAIALLGVTIAAGGAVRIVAQIPPAADEVEIGPSDIGGVVRSRFGPEPGVWVIAETRDLGTRFAKIVVTDERRTVATAAGSRTASAGPAAPMQNRAEGE